jgi:hypothetical protein
MLVDFVERERNFTNDTPLTVLLSFADELEAFSSIENVNETVLLRLLVDVARRISPRTPSSITYARTVITLSRAGERAREADRKRDEAYQQAYVLVREIVTIGMSESEAARVSGFDRMTIRRARGKNTPRHPSAPPEVSSASETTEEQFDLELMEDDEFINVLRLVEATTPQERPRF